MTISKYEILRCVVESGSLTKAGERLRLTQSGVSHALASLEAEIGFPLLTRERSGVQLTANGELVLKYVREILQCNDRLRQKVAEIKGLEIGTVRIGTFASVSSQWLPGIIKEFKAQYTEIEIQLAEGDYDDVNRWILDGTVDFGFVALPVAQTFAFIPLSREKMVCILPKDHPLGGQEKIAFAQINGADFIMPKWGNTDDVRRILRKNQLTPTIKYEVVEDQAIISMVKNGLGISILPEMVLRQSAQASEVQVVDLEETAYRTIGIALQSMQRISPAAKKFLFCIRAWLAEQGLQNC